MSEQKTLLSPKKPDGTTDWDVVFDDPHQGLIALINQVNSVAALQECGQIMINRLFTRKNDQLNVARFSKELNDIISYAGVVGDLEQIKAEVVVMLRKIKAIRVAKARAYLEQKAKEQAASAPGEPEVAVDRRSSADELVPEPPKAEKTDYQPWVVGGGVMAVMLLLGFMAWVSFYTPSNDKAVLQAGPPEEPPLEMDTASGRADRNVEAIRREAERKIADIARRAEQQREASRVMPPALVLPGVFAHPPAGGQRKKSNKLIMPILILSDRKNMSKVCLARPKLIDIVNVALSKSAASADDESYLKDPAIAASILSEINAYVGGNRVEKVLLVTDGKTRDMETGGERCKFASSRYFDYIYPMDKK